MSYQLAFLQPLTELTPRAIDWLWPGRLALGYLSLLEGDPGLGKSLVALDLCARLSTARPWPDGTEVSEPIRTVVLSREDGTEDVVRQRLLALGADPAQVFVPRGPDYDCCLPDRLGLLGEDLARLKPQLLVLDPITRFFGRQVVLYSELSIRAALEPLEVLARSHNLAVLLLRNLNKSEGKNPAYRGLGAIGFLAACRSAWLVGEDPAEPAKRLIAQIKNNLAPWQPSLAYTVSAQDTGQPLLTWHGTSPLTSRQLLAQTPPGVPQARRTRQSAAEFLEEFLKDGPRTSREVWAAAREAGHSVRTLNRAKSEREIRSLPLWVGRMQNSYWLLPGQNLPTIPEAEGGTPELDTKLANLEKQYPSACPLDD
jgi:hypothetical protein